jgi:hypothetical protein
MALLTPHMPAQAALFLGDHIPYPLPWAPAPFSSFITQKGLEQQWSTVSGETQRTDGSRRTSGSD